MHSLRVGSDHQRRSCWDLEREWEEWLPNGVELSAEFIENFFSSSIQPQILQISTVAATQLSEYTKRPVWQEGSSAEESSGGRWGHDEARQREYERQQRQEVNLRDAERFAELERQNDALTLSNEALIVAHEDLTVANRGLARDVSRLNRAEERNREQRNFCQFPIFF